jgi:hypothetical protein
MQGLAEARMTVGEITSFLAHVRKGTRVTVRYGEIEHPLVLYDQKVASDPPQNGRPLTVQRTMLSSGSVLQKSRGGWIFCESGGRGTSFPLLAIQPA